MPEGLRELCQFLGMGSKHGFMSRSLSVVTGIQ